MIARLFFTLLIFTAVAACASPGRDGPGGGEGGPGEGRTIGVNMPSALLAKARETQAQAGCAKAAPTYRVVASFGAGYEIAQYELGACLMEMEGGSEIETALFREEGMLWLNRAAYAGNPRAQLKLAEILSGALQHSRAHVSADPQRAMVWSVVYEQNGARETFGLKPVGPVVTAHLQSVLSTEAIAAARAEAKEFQKIELAEFTPPAQARSRQQRGGQSRQRPPEGRRRPR